MSLEEFHTIFMAVSLALTLLVAAPTLSMVVRIPKTSQPFSELWLLGPDHMAEDFPFNITVGEEKLVFLGVSNHLGHSAYYVVYAKFRNQTQPPPDAENSTPSPNRPLHEFRFFLADGRVWETPINFTILDASIDTDTLVVKQISINDVVFEVEYTARRDLGLFFQMFFELWFYNVTFGEFQYHNRFVSIWLKVTG